MGLFGRDPKVPNTISDRDFTALQDRAVRAEMARGGMFTAKSIKQRQATSKQSRKAGQS